MKVRVAVIGAGRMGRTHLAALERSERCSVAAVVDPVAPADHASVDGLLGAGGFDAVLIAAPTDLHLALIEQLREFPILCEKPCGLTAEDAARAASLAPLLQVGYWRRFVPSLQRLRGHEDVSLIACHQWDERPPPPSFREHSGGIAIDMAVHEIDQIRWLLGQEFGDISAAGSEDGDDPDTALAISRLSGDTVAAITLGRHFPPGDTCWIELFAGDGYVREEFMTSDEDFLDALVRQADAFAGAVLGEPQLGASGEDAVAALRVAERISSALRRSSSSA